MSGFTAYRLLTLRDVKQITTLSSASIYRFISAGRFPKPVHLSANRRAWRASEVEAWVEAPLGWDEEHFDAQDEFYAER